MKLAIMQPYVFPYLGYFQLLGAADKFVTYDDVAFIKQGWINRNRLLVDGQPLIFTIPLSNPSSFRRIKDTEVDARGYRPWLRKFLATLDQAYRKAAHHAAVRDLVERTFADFSGSIGALALRSLKLTSAYLGLHTEIVDSSTIYGNDGLHSQDRVIDICLKERATEYLNLPGGRELYSPTDFVARGIELKFVDSRPVCYLQFGPEFVPGLSIIDVLMFNPPEQARAFVCEHELSPR